MKPQFSLFKCSSGIIQYFMKIENRGEKVAKYKANSITLFKVEGRGKKGKEIRPACLLWHKNP